MADFKLCSGTQPSTKSRPNRYINKLSSIEVKKEKEKNPKPINQSHQIDTPDLGEIHGHILLAGKIAGSAWRRSANTTDFRMLPRNLKQRNYLPKVWQPGTAALPTGTEITHL